MKQIFIVIGIVLFTFRAGVAADADLPAMKTELSSVPAPERPAQAAKFVKAAKPIAREAVTRAAVSATVGLNPAAGPAVVGAIAGAVPEMAAVAAGAAAETAPQYAAEVAKAAVGESRERMTEVIAAVCRAAPGQYKKVAVAVSRARRSSAKDILYGLAVAFPDLQPDLDRVLATRRVEAISVRAVLDEVRPPTAAMRPVQGPSPGLHSADPGAAPPGAGPPPGVGPGNPPGGGNGGPGPRGHRNYASP